MDDIKDFWESFYGGKHQVWSGRPNDVLVRHTTGMTPGRALDLGCGEGADAIWLAQQGWRVTAIDISQTALERAATHARAAAIEDRIEWIWGDLAASLPAGSFDLVSALYLHSPVTLDRDEILRRFAQIVAPQGRLLVVGHAGMPHSSNDPGSQLHYPTPEDLIVALALPDKWRVEVLESLPRLVTAPDGRPAEIVDATVMLRRVQ